MPELTVRYFAGARAAAGVDTEILVLPTAPYTLAEAVEELAERHGPAMRKVLAACSFLLDEVAVRSHHARLPDGAVLDVLPPFAGG